MSPYSVANDTLNGTIDVGALRQCIEDSGVVAEILGVSVRGDVLETTFATSPSTADWGIVDGLVATHSPDIYTPIILAKFKDVEAKFNDLMHDFGAENSLIMMGLGYTVEQKAAQVAMIVPVMRPVREAIQDMDYYSIWATIDALPRSEPLMTEARITAYKTLLYNFING